MICTILTIKSTFISMIFLFINVNNLDILQRTAWQQLLTIYKLDVTLLLVFSLAPIHHIVFTADIYTLESSIYKYLYKQLPCGTIHFRLQVGTVGNNTCLKTSKLFMLLHNYTSNYNCRSITSNNNCRRTTSVSGVAWDQAVAGASHLTTTADRNSSEEDS